MAEADLPIPDDARRDAGWGGQMLELADHLNEAGLPGDRLALLVVERFGGQQIYIPLDPDKNPLRDVLGNEGAQLVTSVYAPARIDLPTGAAELRRARRAGVIACVRAGTMTINEAVRLTGTSRTYMSNLVNHSNEGKDIDCPPRLARAKPSDPRQIPMFPEILADAH